MGPTLLDVFINQQWHRECPQQGCGWDQVDGKYAGGMNGLSGAS